MRIDVGLFFFFVACAVISIIVWIFNWICWLNQCCCCDFLHNPVNKRIAWWISFSFLLGMLACCISACVSINRFGFALDGALCSLDRIYYDFVNGILKEDNPRWAGFTELTTLSGNLYEVENKINNALTNQNCYITETYNDDYCSGEEIYNKIYKKFSVSLILLKHIYSIYTKPEDRPIYKLNEYFKQPNIDKFENLEKNFLKECYDYGNVLFGWMKVLAMIYYCLFLITITFAGVAMMFYACLKRQGYLITIMHVLWNTIRFFMFSFFVFGAAYGIFDLVLKDSISVIRKLFFDNELKNIKDLIPRVFIDYCTERDSNLAKGIISKDKLISELQNLFYTYKELKDILNITKIEKEAEKDTGSDEYKNIEAMLSNLEEFCKAENLDCDDLTSKAYDKAGIFGYFECGFLQNDLNMAYRAIYDISTESKILSALSLTSSFFGAVAVYFYLLVMHHYNNELFFDSGKSIFRGFDGFGGGYKKKNRNQDPAYKKRKLRAEIELTSRNEEDNNYYKDINKNEEDE